MNIRLYFFLLYCFSLFSIPCLTAYGQSQSSNYYDLLYYYEGTSHHQQFGNSVYLTGDVNGDGYGDILIGAPSENVGNIDSAGKAYLYSGLNGNLLYSFDGENYHAYLGKALSDIDDTNCDGLPELLIGSRDADAHGMGDAGKVYHGSGATGTIIHEFCGETFSDSFGADLEKLGDVNGDGIGDFIVGADRFADIAPWNRGAVYIFSGRSHLLFDRHSLKTKGPHEPLDLYKPLFKFEGEYAQESMGHKVCRTGDVDLDGKADFAYLTLNNKAGSPPEGGRVTVRSGVDGTLITEIFGDQPDAKIYRLDYGGDVNNDGYPDLLVGQPNYQNGTLLNAGRARVYSGKDWEILYEIIGETYDEFVGGSLSTAGDLNSDGFCDFMIGAYSKHIGGMVHAGMAFVYSGKDKSLLDTFSGEEQGEYLAISLHGGGDVNGDGLTDIIIGTGKNVNGYSQAGSALVYRSKSLLADNLVQLGEDLNLEINVPALPLGTYYLAFSSGAEPGIPIGSRIFPLNMDALLAVTFGNPAFTGTLNGDGKKEIILPMPNDPGLSGTIFFSAFLVLKPDAPNGVLTISNPEEIQIL